MADDLLPFAASQLFEQLARAHLDRPGKPFHRRDARIPFPRLDPADLGRVDPTPVRNLLLAEFQFKASSAKVWPQLAHGEDR